MSIILDALRRGRGRQTPPTNPNSAQTDAVLQTLGYGRFSPASPFNRFKRVAGYLSVAIAAAVALWVSVVWITEAVLTPRRPASGSAAPAPPRVAAPQPAPSSLSTGPSAPLDKPVAAAELPAPIRTHRTCRTRCTHRTSTRT